MTDVPAVPEVIDCIDCGGRAHLLTKFDDEHPPRPGALATYRCEDCLDRWDLIVPEPGDEIDPTEPPVS
jgi:hypothetical protein